MIRFPSVPASFFGMVLGLRGLGNGWRLASKIWGLPFATADMFFVVALIVWLIVASLYVAKWVFRRQEAIAEFFHPAQCCFIGLLAFRRF